MNHLNKIIGLKNKKNVGLTHLSTVLSLKLINGGGPSVPVPYQLIENGDFASATGWTGTNCSFSVNSNNVGSAIVSATGNSLRITHSISMKNTHKYYYSIQVYPPKKISFSLGFGATKLIAVDVPSGDWNKVEGIYTASNNYSDIRYYFDRSGTLAKTQKVYFCWAQLIDLTATFGAGNEPTTVEEVKALYPNSYYEYNPVE